MASKSNNPYDVYEWIKKVADSCVTPEQCDSTCNLIRNFRNQYKLSDTNQTLNTMANNLIGHLYNKSFDLLIDGKGRYIANNWTDDMC